MIQVVLTVAAGKRLIAKAMAKHPAAQEALRSGTLVIIAGTTNGYVAEEILGLLGLSQNFDRRRFFRGITLPPEKNALQREGFPGDVVIVRGRWFPGKTIFEVIDDLQEGDVILKGANALDPSRKRAAILIGHPKGGTIMSTLQVVVGRRVHLIIPVGLEKRIFGNLDEIVRKVNAPGSSGLRMFPITGEIFTEIEAISLLSGASSELIAGGGVSGAEGAIWLAISGNKEEENLAREIIASIASEPPFEC